jgi:T4-like virus tail tube protein gp19
MAFDISNFKSEGLAFGGARPALFDVGITLPTSIGNEAETKINLTCRAAQLPAATVGSIDVGYFGRMIKIAGDRTFADWTITVMNDEDFVARVAFEKWSNYINMLELNVRQGGDVLETGTYKTDLDVRQFGKNGQIIRRYKIIGAFPTTIDAIDLNWETQNQIETFGVTFSYDYWYPSFEEVVSPGETDLRYDY